LARKSDGNDNLTNEGEAMKKMLFTKIMILAAGLALFAGCATEQVPQPNPVAPPPLRSDVIPPSPDISFSWTPGYWDWRSQWIWMRGYWAPRHPGALWMEGDWVRQGNGYVWVHAHWQ
jgi:hypothetical protein